MFKATRPPVAAEALRRIRARYEIEADRQDLTPGARATQRQARAEPRLEAFKTWQDDPLLKLPPGSSLAKAIGYALGRWAALRVYRRDGHSTIDSNPVERALRGVACWAGGITCSPAAPAGAAARP